MKAQKQLDEFEKLVTTEQLRQCELMPIRGDFDLKHLCTIHLYIFCDVYPFAGTIRDEIISKDGFTFAVPQFIHTQAVEIFGQLKSEKFLEGLVQA